MSDESRKIVIGPGKERWPGSPSNHVENIPKATPKPLTRVGEDEEREANHKRVLRIKAISALQRAIAMAALRFTEDEIRELFQFALSNVRNTKGNDYS